MNSERDDGDAGKEIASLEEAAASAVRNLYAIVHARFDELERAEKFSKQQLANRLGVTRSQVSRWFASPSNMTLCSAAKLLAAMGRELQLGAVDPLLGLASTAEGPVRCHLQI